MDAVHPPQDIAVLHKKLVAAAMRVNDALLAEAQLLRPNERTPTETYAAYIFKFEAFQSNDTKRSLATPVTAPTTRSSGRAKTSDRAGSRTSRIAKAPPRPGSRSRQVTFRNSGPHHRAYRDGAQ
jgi:hypothetical protein